MSERPRTSGASNGGADERARDAHRACPPATGSGAASANGCPFGRRQRPFSPREHGLCAWCRSRRHAFRPAGVGGGWVGGPFAWLLLLPCRRVRPGTSARRSAPACLRVSLLATCPSSPALVVMRWAVHSMTSWRVGRAGQGLFSIPMGSEPGKLGVTAVPPRCGLGTQFGGPLDHQASAWVGCLPFGVARPPEPPECAPRPRGGTSPTHRPLTGLCWPGGRPPGTPRMRSAPARWYFADTGQSPEPSARVRWAGHDRLAVTRRGCSPIAPAVHRKGPGCAWESQPGPFN
jgi:hypothetical protein